MLIEGKTAMRRMRKPGEQIRVKKPKTVKQRPLIIEREEEE